MPRTVRLEITAQQERGGDFLAYVTSPETHSTLLRVPQGSGPFTGVVNIEVLSTDRYPEGVDPPFEMHRLIETWPRDRLQIESSAGLSQAEVRTMFPELFASTDEYDRLPPPVVSSIAHRLDTQVDDGPLAAWAADDGACGICEEPLVTLFDLDLRDARLAFLALAGERLRVVTCIGCTCWVPIHTDVDLAGTARWSPVTAWPDRFAFPPWGQWETRRLGIAESLPQPVTVGELDAFDWNEELPATRLGGRPLWEQSWAYPTCPRCDEPMPFLGQIDVADPPWDQEGVYYAFVDLDCGTACTTYQQT